MGAAGRTWVESWRKGTLQEIPSLILSEDKGPSIGASATPGEEFLPGFRAHGYMNVAGKIMAPKEYTS